MARIEHRIGALLKRIGASVSVAESCTGGLVAHRITNISGSSDYFESGVVSYRNQAKIELLGVPCHLIDAYGPVSAPVARAMAEGVREKRRTTFGLATTGIAGPLGGAPKTPVGTVFIAVAGPRGSAVKRFQFQGRRTTIKRLAAEEALKTVLEYLEHDA